MPEHCRFRARNDQLTEFASFKPTGILDRQQLCRSESNQKCRVVKTVFSRFLHRLTMPTTEDSARNDDVVIAAFLFGKSFFQDVECSHGILEDFRGSCEIEVTSACPRKAMF